MAVSLCLKKQKNKKKQGLLKKTGLAWQGLWGVQSYKLAEGGYDI